MRSFARRFSLVLLLSALLVGADALPALAAPRFQMPFFCGEYRRASTSHTHKPGRLAIDYNVGYGNQDLGSIVVASLGGVVRTRKATWKSYGRYVVIEHGGGWQTIYAHLASIAVRNGARVKQGDKIGWVGNNKGLFLAHLHYEQRYRGKLQHIRINGRRIAYRDNPRSVTYKSANNCRAKPPQPVVAAQPAAPKQSVKKSVASHRGAAAPSKARNRTQRSHAAQLESTPLAATAATQVPPLLFSLGGAIGALWVARSILRTARKTTPRDR